MALPSAIPRITAYGVLARDLIRPRPRGEAIHHATRKKSPATLNGRRPANAAAPPPSKNGPGFRRDPAQGYPCSWSDGGIPRSARERWVVLAPERVLMPDET